jgi:vacuolar-type H+-ATPase subunit C/Vma6
MVENENYRRIKKLFFAEPLSLAVCLAYLFTKLKEITNIRLILKGKEVGLSEADIRKGLVTG